MASNKDFFIKMNAYLILPAFCLAGVLGQKFQFDDIIQQNDTFSSNPSQYWSVKGSMNLTQPDFTVFQPKVVVNFIQELCIVNLNECPTKDLPSTSTACYCLSHTGDQFNIQVGGKTSPSQSGRTLQAVVPGHGASKHIQGVATIGSLPNVTENGVAATYRVDDGPTHELGPAQNISVCPGIYVAIQVCLDKPQAEALLQLTIDGVNSWASSRQTCVHLTHRYRFESCASHRLMFSYKESKSGPVENAAMFTIYEAKDNCLSPSTSLPSTTQILTTTTSAPSATQLLTTTTSAPSTTEVPTTTTVGPHIQTFVLFDTETTGLKSPKIAELSLIGVTKEELLRSNGITPRVLNKLTLCFDPQKDFELSATGVNGLQNSMLDKLRPFKEQAHLVMSFLEVLPQPVCLIAHNGIRFDFKLLRNELAEARQSVPDSILCADSLKIFKELDPAPKGKSFALRQVYQRAFREIPDQARAHTSEGDCESLLRLMQHNSTAFIEYCERNAKPLLSKV